MKIDIAPVRIGVLLCLVLLLSGCGLKGDLYIPEKEAPGRTQPAAAPQETPANGEEQNEGDKPGS